ncbi:hypothetical protein SLE2022_328840 [Rubroshorea leprosula]
MLSLTSDDESAGSFSLSGSIRRQMNLNLPAADGHLCNMGKMIEEMESKLRYSLDQALWEDKRNGLHFKTAFQSGINEAT